MMTRRQAWTSLRMVLGVGLLTGLTGCDYWPPALQAEIEQLRAETQTLAMEKTQLQLQVNELAKSKQDLQIQIDDLSRLNREKTGLVSSLRTQLDTLRAKRVKTVAPKATKAPAKASTKPAPHQRTQKKRSTKKTSTGL
jgi:septum formation inhibitor MinC